MSTLLDIVRELAVSPDLDTVLTNLARRTRLLLGVDMCFVGLPDELGFAHVRAADGNTSELSVGLRLTREDGHGGAGLGPVWTPDHPAEEWFAHNTVIDDVVRAEDLHAVLAAPLTHGTRFVGTLYVADRDVRRFTADEISLVCTLGDLAGPVIEKTRALEKADHTAAALRTRLSRADTEITALRERDGARHRLADLVLAGGDLHTLADEAHRMFDGAVRIFSADGSLLATAGTLTAGEDGTPVTTLDTDERLTPIQAADEELGTLSVHPCQPLTEQAQATLRAVAQMAAILLHHNKITVIDTPAREALFDEFLSDTAHSPHLLERRASRLGIYLDKPHVVVMARPDDMGHGRSAFWSSSYAYRKNGLRSIRDGNLALLVPGADPAAVAGEVLAELSRLLGNPVTVAVSQPVSNPGAIAHAYQEATRYLEAMAALGVTGCAASARELGFLGVLLSDDQDVDGFIRRTIGPVLDYDQQRSTELVHTMEAYFGTGSSPTYAAEKLHVHPNTVTRRLDRISELLGPDWQEPARVLDIQVALRVSRIKYVLCERRAPTPT